MDSLAPSEPYTHSFEATVENGGTEVVLSETYFYPEGGGQPADRGTVAGVAVEHVRKGEAGVVHELAELVETGRQVSCAVDAEFRSYCMRAHTASHALYGAGRQLFDGLGYGGFGITAEPGENGVTGKVRVDLETGSTVDDDALAELERLVNRVVWDARPVTWESVDRETALSDERVAFNTKTEEGLTGAESVRLVDIEGWDRAACGGTHVRNTREIGPVTVLERSNPGEGQTRVEFAVGETAIERRATERRSASEAARLLGTPTTGLAAGVERVQEAREAAEAEARSLRERYVEERVARLAADTFERDGATWLVGEIRGLDANALGEQARSLAGETADVVVLVGAGALAVGSTGEPGAGEVTDRVTGEFGGGGGGSPTAAQAGGFDAEPAAVVDYLRP
jgi:alanyl-tRNA synthetase